MIDFQDDIEAALPVLKRGGSILYPTDTVWGLGCDATDAEAVDRIYALKQRPQTKSMIVLVAEERDILKYVASPDMEIFDYLKTTARPTTVIYDGAINLAENVISDDGSVAIRIVKDTFCRHLIKRLRKPLVSTSANISGQAVSGIFRDIPDIIRQGAGYIVRYRQEDEAIAAPSSIIRWRRGRVEVIR